MKKVAAALEWSGTLGAAGLWAAAGVYKTYPNIGLSLVSPSNLILYTGVALLALGLVGRSLRKGHVIPSTILDLPMLLFLVGAFIGWWVAYNPELGTLKLHLLISAVAIYYLLADAKPEEVHGFVAGFLLLAAGIAVVFCTQHDFAAEPSKYALINQIGLELNDLVPQLDIPFAHSNPNVIGTVLALALPFNLGWLWSLLTPRRQGTKTLTADAKHPASHPLLVLILLLTGLLIAFGLLMTTSRGAWLALGGVVGIFLAGQLGRWLGKKFTGRSAGGHWGALVALMIAIVSGLLLYLILLTRTDWLGSIPGGGSAVSRADFYGRTLSLGRDYFFSGAGLGAFQMVYSTYSLLIHVGFSPHAHNLFLQIWLEQGLLGILALGGMVLCVAWMLPRFKFSSQQPPWVVTAAVLSFAVLMLHGLLDSTLYGTRPTALLFVPLGLIVNEYRRLQQSSFQEESSGEQKKKVKRYVSLAILVLIMTAGAILHRPLISAAYANLGSVRQTQAELSVYTWPEWPIQDEVRRQVDMEPTIDAYRKALDYDPKNLTANRRLGMISLSLGKYEEALPLLETAFASDPGGVTTRQMLGEALIVNGRVDEGADIWANIDNNQKQHSYRAFWYHHIGDEQQSEWVDQTIERFSP